MHNPDGPSLTIRMYHVTIQTFSDGLCAHRKDSRERLANPSSPFYESIYGRITGLKGFYILGFGIQVLDFLLKKGDVAEIWRGFPKET